MGIPVFFSHGLHGFTQIFLAANCTNFRELRRNDLQ